MIGFLISLALTVVCIRLFPVLNGIKCGNYELLALLGAGVSLTACMGFLAVWVCGHFFPGWSPYRVFAVGAALPEILFVILAICDMVDHGRVMHGLMGGLILFVGLPFCLLVQLADLIVWLILR